MEQKEGFELFEEKDDISGNVAKEIDQPSEEGIQDESEDLKMFGHCPNDFVNYKENIAKYEAIKSLVNTYTKNEENKSRQRQEFANKLFSFMKTLSIVFCFVYCFISLALFSQNNGIPIIIELFKWFAGITLVQFISMVFFIVKYLFKDNEKMFEHFKDLLNKK